MFKRKQCAVSFPGEHAAKEGTGHHLPQYRGSGWYLRDRVLCNVQKRGDVTSLITVNVWDQQLTGMVENHHCIQFQTLSFIN